MKKALALLLSGIVAAAALPASASFIQEEAYYEVAFSVNKAATAWTPDGVYTPGEYFDIAVDDAWRSSACADDANDQTAWGLDYKLALSWDDNYFYTYVQYVDPNGHDNTWGADPASMWYSGALQINHADEDQMGDQRLEYGIGLTSDTNELITTVWADYLASGFAAKANEDFIVTVDGDTVTYEARTPFSAFTTLTPAEGAIVSCCYVLSWGNGQDYCHTQLAEGCTGNGKDAGAFAMVTLAGVGEVKAEAAAASAGELVIDPADAPYGMNVEKTTFAYGEDIMITTWGENTTDWVGIYHAEEDTIPGGGSSSRQWFYCYMSDGEEAWNLMDGDGPYAGAPLDPGKYLLYFCFNDGYEIGKTIEITILEDGETAAEAPAASTAADAAWVTEGLAALYDGANNNNGSQDKETSTWKDSSGNGIDFDIDLDDNNYWTDNAYHANSAWCYFDDAIVDVVNGDKFSVEIVFGEFTGYGASFNTFLNSDNDNFAWFIRNDGDYLEFKNAGNDRPKVAGGMDFVNNSTLTITFDLDECEVNMYVDGEMIGQTFPATNVGADSMFLAHADASRNWEADVHCIRYYTTVLTADQIAQNVAADQAKYFTAAPAAEEVPAEEPAVEETPAEEPAVEETPVEEPAAITIEENLFTGAAVVEISGLETEGSNLGEAAIDGDITTRWASNCDDAAYIVVDLGKTVAMDSIDIYWETACAADYTVEVSTDNENWTVVATVTDNAAGTSPAAAECMVSSEWEAVNARYVKINCTRRNTAWGNSIWEMVAFESDAPVAEEVVEAPAEEAPAEEVPAAEEVTEAAQTFDFGVIAAAAALISAAGYAISKKLR